MDYLPGKYEASRQTSIRMALLSWLPSLSFLKLVIYSLLFFLRYNKTWTCAVCNGLRFGDKRLRLTEENTLYLEDHTINCRTILKQPDGTYIWVYKKGHSPPYPSVSDWRRSARNGCRFCQLVLDGVKALNPKWLDRKENKHILAAAIPGRPLQVLLTDRTLQVEKDREIRLEIFSPDAGSRPYWTIGQSPIVIPSNLSQHAATRIRTWLKECDKFHLDCKDHKNPAPKDMPRRVINVGSVEDVVTEPFLEESAEKSPYIALSYCWGKTKARTTLKNNIEEHRRRIPLSHIPQTIKEAIAVARLMHVQYLWVDALCIVQDDKEDKDMEIGKMRDVYSQAYLVITASSSEDCNDGFLGQQLFGDRCWQAPFYVSRRFLSRRKVLYARRSTFVTHQAFFMHLPLFRRAWTLQELWLPTRILHFTRYELVWSCNHGSKCECGTINPRSESWPVLQIQKAKRVLLNSTETSRKYPLYATDVYGLWYKLVADYTSRGLSVDTDKLPAVSGLARFTEDCLAESWDPLARDDRLKEIGWCIKEVNYREFQGQFLTKHQKDSYRAGLWEGDLIRGLLWMVRLPPQPHEVTSILQEKSHAVPLYPGYLGDPWTRQAWPSSWPSVERRQHPINQSTLLPDETSYLGPTWSWVPAKMPVEYGFAWAAGTSDAIETEFKPDVSVEETHCVPCSDQNPLSRVKKGAYIVLKGKLATVRLRAIRSPGTMDGLDLFGLEQQVHTSFVARDILFLIRAEDGLIYTAVADSKQGAEGPSEPDTLVCWSENVRFGKKCTRADTCKCGQDFTLERHYCLLLGTLRVKIGSKVSLIRSFWLVLRKSKPKDCARTDTFERIGLGFKSWSGWEPSNFTLFNDAKNATIKIV